MLLLTLNMDTVSRFRDGVHKDGDCRRNKKGFAAIGSASKNVDLHKLSDNIISSSLMSSSQDKKKTFVCSDILAYLLMKNIMHRGLSNAYILLLSSGSVLSSTVEKMLSSLSDIHNIIIVVQKINTEFLVTMTSMDVHSVYVTDSDDELVRFFLSLNDLNEASAVIYPKILEPYEKIVSKCQILNWCTPLSRKDVYISKYGFGHYFHNAFPWSRFPSYSGFTIGNGPMRQGSIRDRQRYIGSFNFYESMISSVPLDGSCTDCTALQTIGRMISILIKNPEDRRESRLSTSSIEALKELDERMKNAIRS